MRNLRGFVLWGALGLACAGAAFLAGCSSSPDESELRQLDDLKKEYAGLQSQVASREQEKSALEQEIAGKNARLKKCHDDEAVVRQRLAK